MRGILSGAGPSAPAQEAPRAVPSVGDGARSVADLAGERAADAEAAGELPAETGEALRHGGFARHFVPAAHGGSAGGFRELTDAVELIGASCAATAWCASLFAHLGRMAGYLPAEGQQELWAAGPDALVVGSLSPTGRAHPAPGGGWLLTGTWPYVSGVGLADWVLLCGVVPPGSGRGDGSAARSGGSAPDSRVFAVPRSALEMTGAWSSPGMRATGSHTVSATDVPVPEARSFRREDLFTGHAAQVPGATACHRVPLQAVNGLSFAGPVLGAARGALDAWRATVDGKLRAAHGKPRGPGPSRAAYADVLARSAGEIDAVRLLLERAGTVADRGAAVTPGETARNLRDCALGAEQLVAAVNRLFRTSGTGGQSTDRPLQRHWRDVNSAATHVALQFEPAAAGYLDQLTGTD